MKEERYFYVPNAEESQQLPEEEATHAARVLRMKEGDEITLIDGKGAFFKAELTLVQNKHCHYHILSKDIQEPLWKRKIHIAMAPTKMMERTEWFTEKATEIGIDKISFLDCQFSERHTLRLERIEKILVAAMKQSHKAWKPEVAELTSYHDFIQKQNEGLKFICHCNGEISRDDLFEILKHNPSPHPITILIGPEGDFSTQEIKQALDYGYQSVSLGKSRLRTETAALSAVMMAHLA